MRHTLLILLLFGTISHAATFLVTPGESIQSAVNMAQDYDTVLIADGIYEETVVLYGKTLMIASHYLLDGDTSHIGNTVIRPSDQNADTASCIIYGYGEEVEGRIVGLSLADGRGTTSIVAPDQKTGGCVHIKSSAVSIQHCRLLNGRAYVGGGVLVEGDLGTLESASVVMDNVTISNCFAEYGGGGGYLWYASASITNSIFEYDSSSYLDGGLLCLDSHTEVDSCVFRHCCGWIGGLNMEYCTGHVRYSLFEENGALEEVDAGICHFSSHDSPIDFSANIVRDNATGNVAAIYTGDPVPCVIGNVFENNTTTYISATVLVGWAGGGDFAYNIIRDNQNSYGGALQAFQQTDAHIHHNYFENNRDVVENYGSAFMCVTRCNPTLDSNLFIGNYGISAGWGFPGETHLLDMRNNWWGHETGPYHATYNPNGLGDTLVSDSILFIPWLTVPPDTTMPMSLTKPKQPVIPGTWHIMNLFPNPFNSEFTIILAGFTRSDFSIKLYDILGREAAVIQQGALTGGRLSFRAPPELASGVYFLRAADRSQVDTRKV
ncbi:T9SS type A sorting domain-containing protein, partial [bacterium]|nr:T9SS type A sorting domain-containing protein [bacterium]